MPGKHEVIMQPAATDPSSGAKVQIEVRPGERKTVKLEPGTASKFLEPQVQLGPGNSSEGTGARPHEHPPSPDRERPRHQAALVLAGGRWRSRRRRRPGHWPGSWTGRQKGPSGLPGDDFPQVPKLARRPD